MIALGKLVYVPNEGAARVFANFGTSVGIEMLKTQELVWIQETKVVCPGRRPPEEPTEEEVAFG